VQDYDSRLRPGGDQPIKMKFSSYMLRVDDIYAEKGEIRIMFYFRQFWTDERLNVKEETVLSSAEGLWTPDTYIINERKEPPMETEHFIRIRPGGEVLWSQRLTKQIKCGCMKKFIESGESTCDIEMESYGYKTKDVVYEENTDNDAFLYEKVTQHLDTGCVSMVGFEHEVVVQELLSGFYNRLTMKLTLKKK